MQLFQYDGAFSLYWTGIFRVFWVVKGSFFLGGKYTRWGGENWWGKKNTPYFPWHKKRHTSNWYLHVFFFSSPPICFLSFSWIAFYRTDQSRWRSKQIQQWQKEGRRGEKTLYETSREWKKQTSMGNQYEADVWIRSRLVDIIGQQREKGNRGKMDDLDSPDVIAEGTFWFKNRKYKILLNLIQ